MGIEKIKLQNGQGTQVGVLSLGATLQSIYVRNKEGELLDLLLGYSEPSEYFTDKACFGCIVGRVANRISNSYFILEGKKYDLANNLGSHHIHGGTEGFNKKNWSVVKKGDTNVKLAYKSLDGEEGYPGNLDVEVSYLLTNENEIVIDYYAVTDRPTPVSLTNHAYFNLSGHKTDIFGHEIQVLADSITETNTGLIPTGEIKSVEGTPYDLRKSINLGNIIKETGGVDDNYLVNEGGQLKLVSLVSHGGSGIKMEVFTTKPGLQVYTGNNLQGIIGKKGKVYNNYDGFCLETQYYPDSINRPEFPSIVLYPEKIYKHTTIYKFSLL